MNPHIDAHGSRFWRNESRVFHREDGPAIEYDNGDKQWFIDEKLHREDGPAIEYTNGYKYWYYHGKWINCKSQEEFLKIIKLRIFW